MNNWIGDIIISSKLQWHANKQQLGQCWQHRWLRGRLRSLPHACGLNCCLVTAVHVLGWFASLGRWGGRCLRRLLWDYTALAHPHIQLQSFDSCRRNLESFINIGKWTFILYFASSPQGIAQKNKSPHPQSDVERSQILDLGKMKTF